MRKTLLPAILTPLLAIQGAYAQPAPDAATVVSDVQVTAPQAVPVPVVGEGAPLLSVEQLQGFACEARSAAVDVFKEANGVRGRPGQRYEPDLRGKGLNRYMAFTFAVRARDATRFAEQVRREAAAGRRTQKEVEDAELARQAAVRRFQRQVRETWGGDLRLTYHPAFGIDPAELKDMHRLEGSGAAEIATAESNQAPAIDPYLIEADLDSAIENIATRTVVERGKRFLVVTGTMRNIRSYRVLAQGLLISVLDQSGRVIDMAVADSNRTRIPPGKMIRFSYRLENPPAYAHKVRVTFAAPGIFTERNFARSMQCPDPPEGEKEF